MGSLWQSCCQATQNIFQTVLRCNPLGNVTEKTKQNTCAHCQRRSARWRRSDTRGCSAAMCSYSQLRIVHWCSAALCWHTLLFFFSPEGSWDFVLSCICSGDSLCTTVGGVQLIGLYFGTSLSPVSMMLIQPVQMPSTSVSIFNVFHLFTSCCCCLSPEHSGQADQEDEPGSRGGEQQLERAVC